MKIRSIEFDIKKMIKRSLPPTIISIILLPTLGIYFGMANILIAPYMALMYIRLREYTDIDKSHIKPFFLHLLIGIIATLAGVNAVFTLLINLIGGFVLTYLLTDEYNPSSYFPYLLAFVLLQLIPLPLDKLYLRLLAITFSYLVLYITLKITSPKLVSSKIVFLMDKGFLNISDQFKTLAEGKYLDFNGFKYDLFSICRDMNRVIYFSQKSKYYSYVILFQHLNNITDEAYKRKYLLQDNKDYLYKISTLFLNINLFCTLKDYDGAIAYINKFLKENTFSDSDLNNYFEFLLKYTIDIFTFFKTSKKEKYKAHLFVNFRKINHFKLSLNSFKFRFAVRMGLLLGLSFTFVKVSHLNKSYWLPMTIFLLLMPFYEESRKKSFQRFKGTVIGIVLCSILFFFFTSTTSHIIIIGLSTFLMYSIADFTWLTTYVTCYAIGISTLGEVSGDYKIIFLRLFYTTVSVLIVLLANRFILRNRDHFELRNMIFKLIDIDKDMVREFKNILKGNYDPVKIRELVYLSYLVSAKVQIHNNPNSSDKELTILKAFIFNNNKLTTLLGHEALLLKITPTSEIDFKFINSSIDKIEDILDKMETVFKDHASFDSCLLYTKLDTILTKNTYVNNQMANCLIKTEDTLNALQNLKNHL